jgi:ubiquinol-cytochrome c reductase cytochrome b subunit
MELNMPESSSALNKAAKVSGMTLSFSAALPRIGLASLFICLLSGIILSFYYRPFGNVFQNVEEITSLVPYGWFFRQVHYVTGQAFVFLMLFHTADHFIRRRYRVYSTVEWASIMAALVACFFTLFTGFILKGDKEGIFAGTILLNMLNTIPFAGKWLSRIFIGGGEDFFFLPYLHHCLFLPVLMAYLIKGHIRTWLPGTGFMIAALGFAGAYALLIDPFMDIPPEAPAAIVTGPWFFLGIQTLLKTWEAFFAGILLPSLFILLVFIIQAVSKISDKEKSATKGYGIAEKTLYLTIIAISGVYLFLIIKAAITGP